MGVHGDDIVREIRTALRTTDHQFSGSAPIQSAVRMIPNAEQGGWAHRDGRLEFECLGRDHFRAFRVTVEVLPAGTAVEDSDDWLGADGPLW